MNNIHTARKDTPLSKKTQNGWFEDRDIVKNEMKNLPAVPAPMKVR